MAIWAFVLPVRLFPLCSSIVLKSIGFSRADWASPWMLLNISTGLVTAVTMWSVFVLMAKRLHDFGWSGWFAAPVFYPLAWGLWNAVYMGMTEGDVFRPNTILGYVLTAAALYPLIASIILAIVPGQKQANRHGSALNEGPDTAAQHF
jgi:uncharacterized membrane protein YhaH (DUF805 family)